MSDKGSDPTGQNGNPGSCLRTGTVVVRVHPSMKESSTHLSRGTGYWLIVLASFTWIGAVVLAPYTASRGWIAGPMIYAFFDRICHQIPERSFWAFGHQLAVCHRCLGLYVGFAAGLLLLAHLPALTWRLLQRPRLLVLFVAPMLLDVVWPSNNFLTRFVSGFVATFPVGLLLWAAVEQLRQRRTVVEAVAGGATVSSTHRGGGL